MKPRRLHRLTILSRFGAAIFITETFRRKRCILANIRDDGAKNEGGILTELAREAQFGKLRAGWQNEYRPQI
jgi:hypothetical protein